MTLKPTVPPQSLVPVRVAADLAGVNLEQLESWITTGKVACQRINTKRHVDLEQVLALAAELSR